MTRTIFRAALLAIGMMSAAPLAAQQPAASAPVRAQWVVPGWRTARMRVGPRRRFHRRMRRRRFARGMARRRMAGYWARQRFARRY